MRQTPPHQGGPPGVQQGQFHTGGQAAFKTKAGGDGQPLGPGRRRAIWIALVLIAMVIAFLTLTLPAFRDLSGIFPQLPQLWSIGANRVEIFWLFVKAASPLLILLIALVLYLLWGLLRAEEEVQEKPPVTPSPPLARPRDGEVTHPPASAPISPVLQPTGVVSPPFAAGKRPRQVGQPNQAGHTRAVQRRKKWQQSRYAGRTPLGHSRVPHLPEAAAGLGTSAGAGDKAGEEGTVRGGDERGAEAPPVYLYLTLLGEVTVVVRNPATGRQLEVPMQRSPKRRELLAYVAWQRGKTVKRDKLLHDVFERELSEDEQDEIERVSANFNKHTQLLRNDINAVASQLGLPRLMVLEHATDWWLAKYCRVTDLDVIDSEFSIIERAVREGNLETSAVSEACDRLIEAYGERDFLEKHVMDHEFEPWAQSWVRDPFTTYRDYFLAALWYRAEIERITGERMAGEGETLQSQQLRCFERAASLYERYALYAPKTRFDKKVYGREPGVRISQSERALRRCIDMYSLTNNTQAVDRVYEEYKKLMRQVFPTGVAWKPSPETVTVLEEAKAQTREHRFRGQIQPHEMGEAPERDREQSPS